MGYVFCYYVAMLIAGLRSLSWLAFLASLPIAGYLFFRGYKLTNDQKPSDEPLGSLVDWTNGGELQKRALIIFFAVAPCLYLASFVIPDSRTAMTHMGHNQDDDTCMAPGETGVLIAGNSSNTTAWFSFKMSDGTAIMCQIDNMNARGAKANTIYRVPNGKRVS